MFQSTRSVGSLYSVCIGIAVLFIATLHLRPYPLSYVIKALPIVGLAILVFRNVPRHRGTLIGMGLMFSALGDIILELDRTNYFVFGLAAFLVGHLFYIPAFFRNSQPTRARRLVAVALAAYGCGIGYLLIPNLDSMLAPVTAYLVIIITMGIAAALGAVNPPLIVVGACFFILSDSIIAVNKFLIPVPLSGYWIMLTYYPAQFLITGGALKIGDRKEGRTTGFGSSAPQPAAID